MQGLFGKILRYGGKKEIKKYFRKALPTSCNKKTAMIK